MNVRRIAGTIALAATLITGSATAASAHTAPPERSTSVGAYVQRTPVQTCIAALKWAHKRGDHADDADRAIIVCGRNVRTKRQAAALYEWANRPANMWALEYIG